MDAEVFAAVLSAAALHAGWNALVKGSGDPVPPGSDRRRRRAGTLSRVSYAVALWAMTRVPVGLVAASRDVRDLGDADRRLPWGETGSYARIGAALSIAAGLIVLKIG